MARAAGILAARAEALHVSRDVDELDRLAGDEHLLGCLDDGAWDGRPDRGHAAARGLSVRRDDLVSSPPPADRADPSVGELQRLRTNALSPAHSRVLPVQGREPDR